MKMSAGLSRSTYMTPPMTVCKSCHGMSPFEYLATLTTIKLKIHIWNKNSFVVTAKKRIYMPKPFRGKDFANRVP